MTSRAAGVPTLLLLECGGAGSTAQPLVAPRSASGLDRGRRADTWEDELLMLGTATDETAPLLGRASEQSLLASLLDEAGTRGQALVLRGEPGIGKSRLLAEAARQARERGMVVLSATGVQSRRSCRLPACISCFVRSATVRSSADGA